MITASAPSANALNTSVPERIPPSTKIFMEPSTAVAISSRTSAVAGEIYIGVVGPVRTGKSTFIKRFMELLVLPGLEDVHARERARDELPQSSAGKTIMTTEPKFIPKEAAKLSLGDGVEVRVRLIDCVGFMVEGAAEIIGRNRALDRRHRADIHENRRLDGSVDRFHFRAFCAAIFV